MSCGHQEATEDIAACPEEGITSYIFFHEQEAADILEQLGQPERNTITIHWSWGYADDVVHTDEEYKDLYNRITRTLDKWKDFVTYDSYDGIKQKIICHVDVEQL